MTLPWNDPEATGIGSLVSYAEFRDGALRYIRYLRGDSGRRLARFPVVRDVVLDFAENHVMQIIIDHWPDCERWALHFDFERLGREVTIDLSSSEDDRARASLEVRSVAVWLELAANKCWPQKVDRRKFTLHVNCPAAMVRETLEIAYNDAKRYTTDDLAHPESTSSI